MLVGFLTEDGHAQIPFEEWRTRWAELYPASPALLASLEHAALVRRPFDNPNTVSASQIADGPRKLYLETVTDFYMKPSDMISGFLGTLRHAAINRDDPNFLIEQRFFDDIGSGQIDSFWIPAAMLIELKTVKSYKLKKILETGLGPGSEGYFYALQINRNADLMEHSGATDRVQHLRLEFLPPDLTKATSPGLQKALAAATMDTTITSVVTLDVPRLPTAETTRIYTEHRNEKSEAFNTGYTRICSPAETWDGKRCAEYCPVATQCLAMSRTRNEAHYLAS